MSTQEDKILLSSQIAAYDEMRNRLETDYFGKWVVFHNMELIDTYNSFEDAAVDAIRKFGRGRILSDKLEHHRRHYQQSCNSEFASANDSDWI